MALIRHLRPALIVVLAGLALAGCGGRGNDVATVRTLGQPGGPLPAAAAAAQAPVQAPVLATAASPSGKHPPGPSTDCPAEFAYWTGQGSAVAVHVTAPSGDYIAVSVEAGTTHQQGAMSRNGAVAHDFSFAVAASQVKAVRVRANEAGCIAHERGAP